MKRIDSINARPDVNGVGKVGFHDNADLPGADATYLTPDWLNILQEELCNILEKNSVVLNPNSKQQLFDLLATSADISALAVATQNLLDVKANKTTSVSAGTGLTGGGDLSANRTFSVSYGTTTGTAAQGNDSRINNGQTAYGWGNHASEGYLKSTDLPPGVDVSGKADKSTRLLEGNGITISGNGDLSANRTLSAKLVDNLNSTDSSSALTAAQGKALKDLIDAGGGLGYGQTWQYTNKVVNTIYKNTTGKPIFVSIICSYHDYVYQAVVDLDAANQIYPIAIIKVYAVETISFIVPDGYEYILHCSAGGTVNWRELR